MLMTNLSRIALLGAVALLAAACAKEVGTDNPNYNAETKEVKTQFVFNVSTAQETKQSSAATQATATDQFRGIENAALLTYAEPVGTKILAADKDANRFYDLAAVAAPAQLSSSNSRRVMELSLPIQTNVILFYGKAPYGSADATYSNLYDYYGHMNNYSIGKTAGSADFQAGTRLSLEDYQDFKTVENLFAGIMSMLLNTKLAAGTTIDKTQAPSGVTNKYKFDATIPAGGISWENYNDASGNSPYETGHERYALENKLSTLYNQLTHINTAGGELRAGSGSAVLRMATDMLSVLNEIRCADPNNASEAVAKYFANVVFNRTLKYYIATSYSGDGSPVSGVSFRNSAEIAESYLSDDEKATRPSDASDATVWPTATALSNISTRNAIDFPGDFNIPRGATYLAFSTEKKRFYYPQTFNVSDMGVPGSGTAVYNALSYYYPAELLYFGNSPVRTSSEDKKAADYPNLAGTGSAGWENDGSWDGDWSGSAVEASTRAVAMKYDINYGVAMLGSRVQYSAAAKSAGYIMDNNHNVQVEWHGDSASGEVDKQVPIEDGSFQVTGLIIGGQSQYIGWDHLPYDPGEGYKYGFLYDKAIPTTAKSVPLATSSNWNYTLVYDNFHAASLDATTGIYTPEATQDNVYVAVEFMNNTGKDFYGNHNLIQDGGHFYLIGCLNPANGGDITWPTNYVIPPYNADGTSQKIKRVFIQDYLTSATFTLDMNSLHAAYLTVPDLRASSMSLGLSVDLEWRTGLSFDNVILGQ